MVAKLILMPWMLLVSNFINVAISASPRGMIDDTVVEAAFWNQCSKTSCFLFQCCNDYECKHINWWSKNCVKSKTYNKLC